MSRIRYIKPGFFTNEDLGDCQPLARLLFAGLWCIADREGRLEDRPRRIHVEILPYDDCDCDALLSELSDHGLITRYAVNGRRYIAIPSWSHHQHPHQRESESRLPSPDEASQDSTRQDEASPRHVQGTAKVVPKHSQGDDEPGSNGEWGMGNGERGNGEEVKSISADESADTSAELVDDDVDNVDKSQEKPGGAMPVGPPPRLAALSEDDWQARADAILADTEFPSDYRELADLMAAANKTGKVALSRVVRELYEPLRQIEAECTRDAMRAGLRAAIFKGAPNANYVHKAAASYAARPPGAVSSGRVNALDVLQQVYDSCEVTP